MTNKIIDTPQLEKNAAKLPFALKFGIIAGILSAVWGMILLFIGQEYNQSLGYVGYILPFVLSFVCLEQYKKANGNVLSFGNGWVTSLLLWVFFGIFSAVFFVLYAYVINPGFIDGMLEATIERMEDRGMDDETIEMSMSYTRRFMTVPVFAIIAAVGSAFWGLFLSLIPAAILKKESPAVFN